jgi:hypothetical protein
VHAVGLDGIYGSDPPDLTVSLFILVEMRLVRYFINLLVVFHLVLICKSGLLSAGAPGAIGPAYVREIQRVRLL